MHPNGLYAKVLGAGLSDSFGVVDLRSRTDRAMQIFLNHLLNGPNRYHFPLGKECTALTDVGDALKVVRNEQYSATLVSNLFHPRQTLSLKLVITHRQNLVEQEHIVT